MLFSIKTEQDYQGTFYRALLRTQKMTFYKVMQKANLPDHMEPEDFIKVCVCSFGVIKYTYVIVLLVAPATENSGVKISVFSWINSRRSNFYTT